MFEYLAGKHCCITGASSGIGAEFARQMHAAGCSLLLTARRSDRLQVLQAELNSKRANSVQILALDIADPQQREQLLQKLRDEPCDILVNNAGRGSFNRFENNELDSELQMVALNIDATVATAHTVIPQMKKRGSGAIIALSSIAAFQPLPFMATYAATKSFNFMHAQALRAELAPFNIRVLSVHPGPTDTEFGGAARIEGAVTGVSRDSVEMVVRQSLQALQNNTAFVVPGVRSWLLSAISRALPTPLSTWISYLALLPVLKKAREGNAA